MKHTANQFLHDRRLTLRHKVKTPLRVHIWKSPLPEYRAESLDLSQCGVYFATNTRIQVGETVEVLLKMPREITGEPTTEWRCTGLVVRVEKVDSPKGKLGVGVRFDCYEVSRIQEVHTAPLLALPEPQR